MRTLKVDENAYSILQEAKEHAKKEGIEKPTMSDTIRHLAHLTKLKQFDKGEK